MDELEKSILLLEQTYQEFQQEVQFQNILQELENISTDPEDMFLDRILDEFEQEEEYDSIINDLVEDGIIKKPVTCQEIAEHKYQLLISKYSDAYLSGANWYVGPSLHASTTKNDKIKNGWEFFQKIQMAGWMSLTMF